jgi:cell division protein FtsN
MLPNFEVVVPEKDREVSRERDATPATIERPGVYVLQAGSYRRQEEADRIQAQLKLQGIDANVQRVSVDDDVWHRVRIGPITDLTELNRLRARLRAADLDALVIRVGE